MTLTRIAPTTFSCDTLGAFDLAAQSARFGGWPSLREDPESIVVAFPIEGEEVAAAVVVRQPQASTVTGQVHGVAASPVADRAWDQARATLSLDFDASGWAELGAREPVIGGLQARYGPLRPTLFHSPYEAAAAFIIGHRITIRQSRAIRARIAAELGTPVLIDGRAFAAFPGPSQLLAAGSLPGVSAVKLQRLRAIAAAAQEGWLTRRALRELDEAQALARLQELPGIGPFFARGILLRGAGAVDLLPEDDTTRFAVAEAYGLGRSVTLAQLAEIAGTWRPYRTWAAVLLHVWARNERQLPARRS